MNEDDVNRVANGKSGGKRKNIALLLNQLHEYLHLKTLGFSKFSRSDTIYSEFLKSFLIWNKWEIYIYIKISVLQIETSVSTRFRVILTGIQGAILGGQNPLFKTSQNYLKHGNLP